jgi:cleavage and polyadenylation specificity factor subunit 2
MMEWLGGTISKEDVGEEGTGRRHENRRRRMDDDDEETALGAFALRFRYISLFPVYFGINDLADIWNSSQTLSR